MIMLSVFKGLKLFHKLIISSFVFILPIGVLLWFVIAGFNKDINSTEREIWGNKVISPIKQLLTLIPKHQRLVIASNNSERQMYNKFDDSGISKLEISIDSCISTIFKIYPNIESDYFSTKKEMYSLQNKLANDANIRDQWNRIKKNADNYELEGNVKYYINIIDELELLLRFVGDKSGLILDPDLDSYYLMDITLITLPKMQIEIGKTLNYIQNHYLYDSIDKNEIERISQYINYLEREGVRKILDGLSVSIKEDDNFYSTSTTLKQNLPLLQSKYVGSVNSFIKDLKVLSADTSKDEFLIINLMESGDNLLTYGNEFWYGVNSELNGLLKIRREHFVTNRLLALSLSGFALLIAIVIVLVISRGITRHVKIVSDIAQNIADGDLNSALNTLNDSTKIGVFSRYKNFNNVNDEILRLFSSVKQMTLHLDLLLKQVRQTAYQVTDSASSITSSARNLEATVAEQAASTNEVTSTSNTIARTAGTLTENMSFVADMSNETSKVANEGLEKLDEIKDNMNNLVAATNDVLNNLDLIKAKTDNIGNVITTITKVANQTNLLSLNAAIEAEKAVEFGSGFSVVAREIRRLADQTSNAALDIEKMITEMQSVVSAGVSSMSLFAEKARKSTENTSQISDELLILINKAAELSKRIEEVHTIVQSQNNSSVQINESMVQLNQAAGQTRDSLIEFNKAAEQLQFSAMALNNEMMRFSVSGEKY